MALIIDDVLSELYRKHMNGYRYWVKQQEEENAEMINKYKEEKAKCEFKMPYYTKEYCKFQADLSFKKSETIRAIRKEVEKILEARMKGTIRKCQSLIKLLKEEEINERHIRQIWFNGGVC